MPAIMPIFSIDNITHEGGAIAATLGINKNSEIFNGHFPGQPVVPGACMLQLVKDVLKTALNCKLRLKQAGYLKFISFVDPRLVSVVHLQIAYTGDDPLAVTAQLLCGEAACFKFRGTFSRDA